MRYEERDDDEVVDDDDDDNDDGLPTRTIHATKNLRIRGVHVRSALARKHYQSGPVDKPPLPKKAPADSGKRVVAEWSAIAGATMFETKYAKCSVFHIVEEETAFFPLSPFPPFPPATQLHVHSPNLVKNYLGPSGRFRTESW